MIYIKSFDIVILPRAFRLELYTNISLKKIKHNKYTFYYRTI